MCTTCGCLTQPIDPPARLQTAPDGMMTAGMGGTSGMVSTGRVRTPRLIANTSEQTWTAAAHLGGGADPVDTPDPWTDGGGNNPVGTKPGGRPSLPESKGFFGSDLLSAPDPYGYGPAGPNAPVAPINDGIDEPRTLYPPIGTPSRGGGQGPGR